MLTRKVFTDFDRNQDGTISTSVIAIKNKDKLSINSADVQKDRNTTVNKRKIEDTAKKQRIHKRDLRKLHKIKIFFTNLHFRVRSQKAYFDGHTKVVYTIS